VLQREAAELGECIKRMMLSSIARATRTRLALAPAVQVACRSSSAMKQDTFAEQRAAYKAKMTKLRKVWSEDIADKNARTAVLKQDEKDRIVLKRAKALRVKRLAAQERQEATRLFRARMLAIHERKLAKSHVRAQFRAQRQQTKNDAYVSDISDEAEAWITADNVDRCTYHYCP